MNNKFNVFLSVAVLVIATLGYLGYKDLSQRPPLGANPGPSFYDPLEFNGGVQYGSVNSTSTPASMTLRLSDIQNFDTVVINPTGANSDKTLTFFASSTATAWLPKVGNRQETCFVNATTTAATTITFAAGTGIDLETASSSPTDLTLLAGNVACFQFIRASSTSSTFDINASMVEYTNGD